MSSRLDELTARRQQLQAQCELQRAGVGALYGDLERGTGRIDRVIEVARSVGPALAVGGIALLALLGPGRVLRSLRRGLTVALYASHALRLVR